MNDKIEKDVYKVQPLKKICMTIGELPTSYLETMTYYEMLIWFTNYLRDNIIPTVNNNAEAVKELQNLFTELQNYVNNYFDNLDVQDEINNKLDQMLKDGTLEQIIEQFLQLTSLICFDNVSDMKSSVNLTNGSYAKTLGYYSKNDGGEGLYKIRTITNEDIVDEGSIIALNDNTLIAELIIEDNVNIKQFGAKGDGTTDDTQNIQKAIDYGFNKNVKVLVPSTENFYKTTTPLHLYCARGEIGFWDGGGSYLIGENQRKSRIVKIGHTLDIYEKDSTVVAKNQANAIQQATGITISNLSIEHYDNTSYVKTSGEAIYCNIPRSNFSNLNIISFNGIKGEMFSSLFENIVFKCNEDALHITNGTSNRFNFLYASQCTNPYYISSSYSSLNNVCCDEGRGSLFRLSGMGLSLNECGCESRNAQYIIEILNDFTTLSIRDFYMVRQIGDSANNIALSDCGVIYSTRASIVNIDTFSIAEFNAISSGNSYFFKTTTNCSISTFLKNLRYYKNFNGADNPKLLLWNTNPNGQSPQRFTSQSQDYSYMVSETLKIVPFLGGYQSSNLTDVQGQILNTDNISQNKTIWLDNKTQYTGESGYSNRFLGRRQKGDLQLYNDPLLMNALGLTITNIINNYTWDVAEIPIVLRGDSSSRPSSNLFIGLQYFDTTLGKTIWYNGTHWVDATGTQV